MSLRLDGHVGVLLTLTMRLESRNRAATIHLGNKVLNESLSKPI